MARIVPRGWGTPPWLSITTIRRPFFDMTIVVRTSQQARMPMLTPYLLRLTMAFYI